MSINKSGVKTVAKAKSLMLTCKEYFGLKPEQTTPGFGAEVKELSAEDRADLVDYFYEAGIKVETKSAVKEYEAAGRPIPAHYSEEADG